MTKPDAGAPQGSADKLEFMSDEFRRRHITCDGSNMAGSRWRLGREWRDMASALRSGEVSEQKAKATIEIWSDFTVAREASWLPR
jgi:hypothetical protein